MQVLDALKAVIVVQTGKIVTVFDKTPASQVDAISGFYNLYPTRIPFEYISGMSRTMRNDLEVDVEYVAGGSDSEQLLRDILEGGALLVDALATDPKLGGILKEDISYVSLEPKSDLTGSPFAGVLVYSLILTYGTAQSSARVIQ